jgi:hypothetical protein
MSWRTGNAEAGEKRNTEAEQAAGGKRIPEMAQYLRGVELVDICFFAIRLVQTQRISFSFPCVICNHNGCYALRYDQVHKMPGKARKWILTA